MGAMAKLRVLNLGSNQLKVRRRWGGSKINGKCPLFLPRHKQQNHHLKMCFLMEYSAPKGRVYHLCGKTFQGASCVFSSFFL
jgi:hypothetical protein